MNKTSFEDMAAISAAYIEAREVLAFGRKFGLEMYTRCAVKAAAKREALRK